MVNFHGRDLDAMTTQLRAAGIPIDVDAQSYPNDRFARLHDPEGNPIELWQPAEPATSQISCLSPRLILPGNRRIESPTRSGAR
jgi:hypothetical protein